MGTIATVKATPRTNLVRFGQKGRKGGTKGGREEGTEGERGKIGSSNSFTSKEEDLESNFCLRERHSSLSLQLCPHTCCEPRSQRYSRADVLSCFTASCPTEPMGSLDAAESAQPTVTESRCSGRGLSLLLARYSEADLSLSRLVNVINTLKRALGTQVLSQNERRLHRNVS